MCLDRQATLHNDPDDADLLLRSDVLDQQIVDIDGARVVRVNDLLMQESSTGMRITAADVGLRGALRRLKLTRLESIVQALGYEVPDKLIAWNYVAPLGHGDRHVRLTVPIQLLKELHPSELADILDQLDIERREQILSVMSAAQLAQTLAESNPDVSRDAVEVLSEDRVRRVIEAMPPDEAADLLGAIGYDKAERLLGLMGLNEARMLRELLGYPPDSAGGRMTPSYVAISLPSTVHGAIEKIRSQAEQAETIYYAYVLSSDNRLLGVLSLRELLRSPSTRSVEEIMVHDLVTVGAYDDQQHAARLMSRYNLLALPVTDDDKVMRGIVTVDDIVEVLEEEASQDILQVAGASPGRLGGLALSLAAGLVGVVVLRDRAPILSPVLAVAWLLPLFLRVAQDQGTWSLARSLTVQTRVISRELVAALATAALVGLLVAGFVAAVTTRSDISYSLGLGIFIGSLAAALIGSFLPVAAKVVGLGTLLVRGRLLSVLVGMCSLLVYIWALGTLKEAF
ncbi:MAG: CBS domain-containing protein [Actinomycetota bacterium]